MDTHPIMVLFPLILSNKKVKGKIIITKTNDRKRTTIKEENGNLKNDNNQEFFLFQEENILKILFYRYHTTLL